MMRRKTEDVYTLRTGKWSAADKVKFENRERNHELETLVGLKRRTKIEK
jgi:hypothetical protein